MSGVDSTFTAAARVAFERWYSDEGASPKAIARDNNGNYLLMQAHAAWIAWCNAWDAGVIPLAEAASALRPFVKDEAAKYEDDGANEPLEALRAVDAALARVGAP